MTKFHWHTESKNINLHHIQAFHHEDKNRVLFHFEEKFWKNSQFVSLDMRVHWEKISQNPIVSPSRIKYIFSRKGATI